MMKSAYLMIAGMLLLTASTANAQYHSGNCDENGCDISQRSGRSGRSWRPRFAVEDRDDYWRGIHRDGVGCEDGRCDINGRCGIDGCDCEGGRCCEDGRCCSDGTCRIDGRHCKDGRCVIPTGYGRGDCADGRCEPGYGAESGYGARRDRRLAFPYAPERADRNDSGRRLDDPFRPVSHEQRWSPGYDDRDRRPIPANYMPTRYESRRPSYQSIEWNTSIRRAVDQAARENRPILVQVSAPWCPHCQQMKETSWTNPQLTRLVNERFVAIEVNADEQRDFIDRMGIKSLPTTLVVGSDLQVLDRLQGFQSADQLLQTLSR